MSIDKKYFISGVSHATTNHAAAKKLNFKKANDYFFLTRADLLFGLDNNSLSRRLELMFGVVKFFLAGFGSNPFLG